LGVLDQEPFGPATGYLAFASLALYGLGLSLIAPRVTGGEALLYKLLSHRSALTSSERISILNALAGLDGRSEPLDVEACELTALPQPAQGDSPPRRSLPPG